MAKAKAKLSLNAKDKLSDKKRGIKQTSKVDKAIDKKKGLKG